MKISVIVPAYQVEKDIERCLDSIINQTYKNLEILVIDDGSKDSSGDIADTYAVKDSRIRVIHKKNEGLPQARKTGVENATGEYIGFVDADDWIEPDMFEVLYKEAKAQNDADLCYSQEYKDYEDESPSIILKNPIVEPGEFTYEKKAFFLTHYVSYFYDLYI